MSLSDDWIYIELICTTVIPVVTVLFLRKSKHLSILASAWIACLLFIVTLILLETIYSATLKSGCNDCEQGKGLALAVYITPILLAYLLTAVITSVVWIVKKVLKH